MYIPFPCDYLMWRGIVARRTPSVTDPICGAEFKPRDAAAKSDMCGKTFYFCSSVCREQFEKDLNHSSPQKVA